MFVRNESDTKPMLIEDEVESVQVAALLVECVFRDLDGQGFGHRAPEEESADADDERPQACPPFPGTSSALWKGTSLTAFGHVHGHGRVDRAQVRLSLGDRWKRDLAVFGRRVWRQSLDGATVPSRPEPLGEIPVDWSEAYGGAYDLTPGFFPGTELPHPGGRVAFTDNPKGKGFVLNEAHALGQELPSLEDPARPITTPMQLNRPCAFAPCPSEVGLRIGFFRSEDPRPTIRSLEDALFLQHHAPGEQILPGGVEPGERLALQLSAGEGASFVVPAVPVKVRFRYGQGRSEPARGRVRSIHLDASGKRARVVYGFLHRVVGDQVPRQVHVEGSPP